MKHAGIPILLLLAAGLCGPAAGQEVICFEAESASGIEEPFRVVKADAAAGDELSGDAFLEIPNGAIKKGEGEAAPAAGAKKPPQVVYTFRVPKAGLYFLWFRTWWTDKCSNSFTLVLDDTPPFTFGEDATYKNWHWVQAPRRLKQLRLAAGDHRLVLRNREDGVRIDQVLLTDDRRYVPVDVEDLSAASD